MAEPARDLLSHDRRSWKDRMPNALEWSALALFGLSILVLVSLLLDPPSQLIRGEGGGFFLSQKPFLFLGTGTYILVSLVGFWSAIIFFRNRVQNLALKAFGITLMAVSFSTLLSIGSDQAISEVYYGGFVGKALKDAFGVVSPLITMPLVGIIFLISLVFATDWFFYELIKGDGRPFGPASDADHFASGVTIDEETALSHDPAVPAPSSSSSSSSVTTLSRPRSPYGYGTEEDEREAALAFRRAADQTEEVDEDEETDDEDQDVPPVEPTEGPQIARRILPRLDPIPPVRERSLFEETEDEPGTFRETYPDRGTRDTVAEPEEPAKTMRTRERRSAAADPSGFRLFFPDETSEDQDEDEERPVFTGKIAAYVEVEDDEDEVRARAPESEQEPEDEPEPEDEDEIEEERLEALSVPDLEAQEEAAHGTDETEAEEESGEALEDESEPEDEIEEEQEREIRFETPAGLDSETGRAMDSGADVEKPVTSDRAAAILKDETEEDDEPSSLDDEEEDEDIVATSTTTRRPSEPPETPDTPEPGPSPSSRTGPESTSSDADRPDRRSRRSRAKARAKTRQSESRTRPTRADDKANKKTDKKTNKKADNKPTAPLVKTQPLEEGEEADFEVVATLDEPHESRPLDLIEPVPEARSRAVSPSPSPGSEPDLEIEVENEEDEVVFLDLEDETPVAAADAGQTVRILYPEALPDAEGIFDEPEEETETAEEATVKVVVEAEAEEEAESETETEIEIEADAEDPFADARFAEDPFADAPGFDEDPFADTATIDEEEVQPSPRRRRTRRTAAEVEFAMEQLMPSLDRMKKKIADLEVDKQDQRGAASRPTSSPAVDSTYEQAIQAIFESQKASTGLLQEKLKLNARQANSLLRRMEEDGLVGPRKGQRGMREILVTRQEFEESREAGRA